MALNNNSVLTVTTESVTVYFKSKYVYLTAQVVVPFIENNKLVLLENQTCQIKFIAPIDNYNPELFFSKGKLEIEVLPIREETLVKGAKTLRFTATKIVSYD